MFRSLSCSIIIFMFIACSTYKSKDVCFSTIGDSIYGCEYQSQESCLEYGNIKFYSLVEQENVKPYYSSLGIKKCPGLLPGNCNRYINIISVNLIHRYKMKINSTRDSYLLDVDEYYFLHADLYSEFYTSFKDSELKAQINVDNEVFSNENKNSVIDLLTGRNIIGVNNEVGFRKIYLFTVGYEQFNCDYPNYLGLFPVSRSGKIRVALVLI